MRAGVDVVVRPFLFGMLGALALSSTQILDSSLALEPRPSTNNLRNHGHRGPALGYIHMTVRAMTRTMMHATIA